MDRKRQLILVGCALFASWVATAALAAIVEEFRVPVRLPPLRIDSVGDDYIVADGTWVVEGVRQALPLQTTAIRCEREIGRCTGATSLIGYGKQMMVSFDFYDIVEWGESHVTFLDDSPSCVWYVYTINLRTKSANAVRQKKDSATGLIFGTNCEGIEPQHRLTLKDGSDVWRELRRDARPWFARLVRLD